MKNYKIFASVVDKETQKQVKELSESEAYKDCTIRVMPDAHRGSGCTIGSVIAIGDRVVPQTIGVDISCGMFVLCLGNVEIDLEKLDAVINEHIPSGFNIHETAVMDAKELLEKLHCKDAIDIDYVERSIGTLGGGNHFIEVDQDEDGNKFLVIHSGSRKLGKLVCEYWQKKAVEYCEKKAYNEREIIDRLKAEGREREIFKALADAKANAPKVNKELAYLEGDDKKQYIDDMLICQRYADLNRQHMAYTICKEMELSAVDKFTTLHNYIDMWHNIIRKGAVSALHGERLIIPINMRDGSLFCVGKGNIDWLYSAPHGAGRIMSRAEAEKKLNVEDFKKSMDGVFSTSVCEETIDEAPMVYKDIDTIIKDIEPTVEVKKIWKPIYNFKAKSKE